MEDLHRLPRVQDSWSYLYLEHCRIDQDGSAIAAHDRDGKTPIPCAKMLVLMVGPGTTITHAAVRVLAEHGCLVAWCGEGAVRFYAAGSGETRSARNLLRQAAAWASATRRLEVVRAMYQFRFGEPVPSDASLAEIRGREGVRVRETYARLSQETGVPWSGRAYRRESWTGSDAVNRALSTANSCLYGVCHAAIVSAGFSPGIGFIHTGKLLSFVYDVADLYKTVTTIPVAFRVVADAVGGALETRVRRACRDMFTQYGLLRRVVGDLQDLFPAQEADDEFDSDQALPGGLWDPETGVVAGGHAYGEEEL
jgi:CRISPR-associated protein Cas1